MRLVFAGTPDIAATSLAALLESRHQVVAVITRPDAPAGRGRGIVGSPVRALAQRAGIEVLAPATAREPGLVSVLEELKPDCCPVVAYGGLLPASILGIPPHGWVNLHFSLLPAWRGAAPVQWAILSGDEVTGACTFRIGPGLDDGPVYGCLTETIRPSDTSGDLLGRLAIAGSGLLIETLDAIEAGAIAAHDQPNDGISHAPRLNAADGRIRWSDPLVGVDRRIRAVTPSPGAWTMLDGQRIKVYPLRREADNGPTGLSPGQVQVSGMQVWVGTATRPALLGEVKAQGRRQMPAVDWIRGLRRDQLAFDAGP